MRDLFLSFFFMLYLTLMVILCLWRFRSLTPEKPADDCDSPLYELEEEIGKVSPLKLRRSGRHHVSSPSRSDALPGTFAYSALRPPPGALPKTIAAKSLLPSTPKKPKKSQGWDLAKLIKEKKANGGRLFTATTQDIMSEEGDRAEEDDKQEGSSQVGSKDDKVAEDVVDEAHRRRLLGEDYNERLGKIIKEDMAKKGKQKAKSGGAKCFEFLDAEDDVMDVDTEFALPELPDIVTGLGADLLRRAIADKGTLVTYIIFFVVIS